MSHLNYSLGVFTLKLDKYYMILKTDGSLLIRLIWKHDRYTSLILKILKKINRKLFGLFKKSHPLMHMMLKVLFGKRMVSLNYDLKLKDAR